MFPAVSIVRISSGFLGALRVEFKYFRAIDFYSGVAFLGVFSLVNSAVLMIVALNEPLWRTDPNVSDLI